ncbi:MAG TPA: acetylxylan esterase [Roseimicrobium sp.]|nr:acetylxylan esterase [Roseimicrobium sp.]
MLTSINQRRLALLVATATALITGHLFAVETSRLRLFPSPPQESQTENLWKPKELFNPPATNKVAPQVFAAKDGISPLFYDGALYRGKPTRVFAWLGVPEGPGPFPGIVLVHGGGGTAYRDWVKTWMARGYAAIAMDTNGEIPLTEDGMRVKSKTHEFAGPSAKGNGFDVSDQPPGDQWVYHSVVAVIKAHTLLRTTPRVDPDRIGITGISWGGVMTEIAASVDTRFKCAAPIYGCGFLGEDSLWLEKNFQNEIAPERVEQWLRLWDPSQYVTRIHIPVLFCDGTNDKFFRLGSLQKTIQLVPGPVTRSLRVRMAHGHPPHSDPPEVTVFMNSFLKGGHSLPAIGEQGRDGDIAWVKFASADDVADASLVYTTDGGRWLPRNWLTAPAKLGPGRVTGLIPKDATAYYFNLTATAGANVSSPLVITQEL